MDLVTRSTLQYQLEGRRRFRAFQYGYVAVPETPLLWL
jgi:hypothetical protein